MVGTTNVPSFSKGPESLTEGSLGISPAFLSVKSGTSDLSWELAWLVCHT